LKSSTPASLVGDDALEKSSFANSLGRMLHLRRNEHVNGAAHVSDGATLQQQRLVPRATHRFLPMKSPAHVHVTLP